MVTGQRLVDVAAQHLGQDYYWETGPNREPVVAEYANPDYDGPWDCAELVSWCVYQAYSLELGIKNGEASTAYWNKQINGGNLLTEISLEDAAKIPGAIAVSTANRNGESNGNFGHIVVSDGQGETWEARAPLKGII